MKMKSRIFTIIVGDLVRSGDISARQQLSHKIRLAIDHLSREFRGISSKDARRMDGSAFHTASNMVSTAECSSTKHLEARSQRQRNLV